MRQKFVNYTHRTWLWWEYRNLARISRFDPLSARIISGDPRGGTTWLAQLLNKLSGSALVWEPLMVSKVKEIRRLGFQWRQYIPETEVWPGARNTIERILGGRLLSPYLCQETTPQQLKTAHYLLIKFCRANQLLPWLTRQFDFRYPPVYLVRHPCAVVASQIKQGGWSSVPPSFAIPEGRYNAFYTDHAPFLSKIDTVEKRLAAMWCLCNRVPLHHPDNNQRWITVTYEALLLNGSAELARIEKRWNVRFSEHVYDELKKASETTVRGSPIMDGRINEQLGYWKRELSYRQIEDVLNVMDYFGIDLYNYDLLPTQSFVG